MINDTCKKTLVLGIIVLFSCMSITTSISTVVVKKPTIPLSNGYIQNLIDNASIGDTIYIPSGTYYENIVIDKSINLIGKDKNTTIIDGKGSGNRVYISADWVNISGFTIKNTTHSGIYLSSNYSTITGNNIVGFNYISEMYGIYLRYSNCNTIFDNKISLVNMDFNEGVVGVQLSYSNNNVIIENNISNIFGQKYNSGIGVGLFKSYNNTITGNVISDNSYSGIYISYSAKNNINGNFIFSNPYGLCTSRTNNNTISYNNFTDNYYGIFLYSSDYFDVLGNFFFNDGIYVYDSYHNNVKNNTVNDKPLIYLEDKSDKVILEAGQVILVSCDNITVENQNVSDTTIGIELWRTHNSKICNNNCFNVRYCIYSKYSHNNNLSNNNFSTDTGSGLYLYVCKGVTISSNTISNGYGCGIFLKESWDTTICNNKISTKYDSISLDDCSSITITNNNICLDNYETSHIAGIYLSSCHDIIITSNKIDLNGSIDVTLINGITILYSYNNFISSNIISNIGFDVNDCDSGIISYHSDSNTISSNYITKFWRGIYIRSSSDENIIIANYIIGNRGDGIYFLQSSNNTVSENTLKNNEFGISLHDSSHSNNIYHNNFINNTNTSYDSGNNTWDDGEYGNYWSDYKDRYPKARKKPFKGIWDTPYEIEGGHNKDNYPLIKKWRKSKSEFITKDGASYSFHRLRFIERFPLLKQMFPIYLI